MQSLFVSQSYIPQLWLLEMSLIKIKCINSPRTPYMALFPTGGGGGSLHVPPPPPPPPFSSPPPPPPQCQDLPGSLSSSPLSHLDSYAGGRSMDLLLPLPESGRKKSADLDPEAGQRARSERHRTHVRPPPRKRKSLKTKPTTTLFIFKDCCPDVLNVSCIQPITLDFTHIRKKLH